MTEVELDVAFLEVPAFEPVVGRVLVVHAEAELPLAGCLGPFREEGTEGLGRAVVDAEVRVEREGEARG
jgi:hypothetical protein